VAHALRGAVFPEFSSFPSQLVLHKMLATDGTLGFGFLLVYLSPGCLSKEAPQVCDLSLGAGFSPGSGEQLRKSFGVALLFQ
jgi:hypothetical protein